MSDSSQDSAGAGEQQWPSKKQDGSKGRPFLFGLLAIMLVALGYDYMVARPAVRDAYDKIANASVEMNAKGARADSGKVDFLSNEAVQEMLGREPNETFMDGEYQVEVYNFMGGLIVKPHKLYTVYRKSGDDWMFSRHSSFIYEASSVVTPARGIVEAPEGEQMSDDEYALGSGDSNAAASVMAEREANGEGGDAEGEQRPSRPEMESDEEPAEAQGDDAAPAAEEAAAPAAEDAAAPAAEEAAAAESDESDE